MRIMFIWDWLAEIWSLLGGLLLILLTGALISVVLVYLFFVLRYMRSTVKKREGASNAFTYAWNKLVDIDWNGAGKIFALFGVVFAVLSCTLGLVRADAKWDDHVEATIGMHYKIVSTDHFHRTVTVDQAGCYVTFKEYMYFDDLEQFIGSGEADLDMVGFDWEGNLEQPCLDPQ